MISLRYIDNHKAKFYEIDQKNTLNRKVKTLDKANIEHSKITYIPVDYNKESWADKLEISGFDKTMKTLFIWQSVSLYLDEDIVKDTLVKMSNLSAKGSVIAQDFYSESFVFGQYSRVAKKNMNMIEKRGEPLKFGLDMTKDPKEVTKMFLEKCHLEAIEIKQFGEKLNIEPFYLIVEAIKK